MNLRFHWMLPKGGEVAMKTTQETCRALTTKRRSPAALPDMDGWVRFARVNAVVWALWAAVSLVVAHAVVLFPLVLTLPWAVARLVWAPRWRLPSRA